MFQRVFYRKSFCKLLSSHLWRSFITLLVKFSSFSVFVWTALDKCVWRMKIILWDASSFKHSNNIQVTAWNYKSLITKMLHEIALKIKATSPIWVIKSKKQYIARRFSACSIGHSSKIAPEKSGAMKLNLSRPVIDISISDFYLLVTWGSLSKFNTYTIEDIKIFLRWLRN